MAQEILRWVVIGGFVATLLPLCLIGVHRLSLAVHRLKMGRVTPTAPPTPLADPAPRVTIQLPLFNERLVARRLIEATAAVDYPADRLQIQVLDDSTDETTTIARQVCGELRDRGVDAEYLHRVERVGFKAGALAAGLDSASGELVAIFDADFVPDPGFLRSTVPWFADEGVGMVQARWAHLNRRRSLLTRLQSLLLDGHFLMESAVRFGLGVFFNFNGTAGIWRRATIDDAGGWSGETLTEDLDLSYRAQLAGWRFVFLEATTVPAELPERIRAFRSQQHRWTKGSIQVGGKLLRPILAARLPAPVKLEAFFHLYSNLAFPLVLGLSLLLPLALYARGELEGLDTLLLWGLDLPVLGLATLPIGLFYLVAEHARRDLRPSALLRVPLVMALGLGMSVNNSRAVLEGLVGIRSPFVRTPKVGDGVGGGGARYRSPLVGRGLLELAIAAYYTASVAWAASHGLWASIPFLCLFLVGFAYVGLVTVFEPRA